MKSLILTLAVIASFWVGRASAETLYVKTSGTELRESTAATSKVLGSLSQGTKVDVISKSGSWVQVKAGVKNGWIYKFKLSTTKPAKGDSVLAGLGGGGASAREGSTASSIRGLSPTSEKYAGRASIKPEHIDMVKHMESVRVSKVEVENFLKEGKLGEFSGGQ